MIGNRMCAALRTAAEAFTALNLQGKEKPADVDGGLEGIIMGLY
jgi:hypothetical protein